MSNSKINKNSITPNGIQIDSEGYVVFYPMGTNKIEIPKNSPYWPKGNKLIGSFVYDDNKLVGFCDTKAMTTENEGIVVMPYEYIDTEFDSIEKDRIQIHAPKAVVKKASWTGGEKEDIPDVEYKYKGCKNLTQIQYVDANYLENDIVDGKWTELLSDLINGSNLFQSRESLIEFKSDLSSLEDSRYMFFECSNLNIFESDMSFVTYAYQMFYKCKNLLSFESELSSLENGGLMFCNCSNLTSFNCYDLNKLNEAYSMFGGCTKLISFALDMKNLSNGTTMFNGCSNLISFSSKIPSLVNGYGMFHSCEKLTTFDNLKLNSLTNGFQMFYKCFCLTHFNAELNSLTDGTNMFYACKLDAPSIKNIIDTINTVETGEITLGMGCDNNQTDINLFAQEVGYPDMTSLLETLQSKGWTVTTQYNGRPSTTFSLRKPDSLPVYVKLVEIIPTEENSFYEYTSQDGSKFYNLDWFHETTGSTDTYTQFNSLEEAISTFNIKPIEK